MKEKLDRYKLVLRNKVTGERKRALAKHAEMLSKREARFWVKRSQERGGEWEYVMEPVVIQQYDTLAEKRMDLEP